MGREAKSKSAMQPALLSTSNPVRSGIVWLVLLLLVQSYQARVVPIYGNGSIGYYYVNLYLGEQAQPASVIIDTGSSLTCLPCNGTLSTHEGCGDKCGTKHFNKPHEFTQSTGYAPTIPGNTYFGWRCFLQSNPSCPFSIVDCT